MQTSRPVALALGVAFLALAAGPPGSAPAQPADTLTRTVTLEEALALARENAPASIRARGEARIGRARVRSAYAAFIPNVTLSAGATRQYRGAGGTRVENGQVITLPSEPWSHSASLGANLELFDGGRRIFELKQARAEARGAEANQVAEQYNLDLEVKVGFFDVLATQEVEGAARSQLELAEQQLRAAVLRIRVGRATKSDSLRSVIQAENARLAVVRAETDLEAARASLARIVGVSERLAASVPPEESPQSRLSEAGLRQLVERSPSVRQAEATLASARASRSVAWTDYLPALTASYSRSGTGVGDEPIFGTDDLSYSGTLRLSVSLPVFNQLGREEQVVRASVSVENAEAGLRDARLRARESLTRLLGVARAAEQAVRSQTIAVEAAEEDRRVHQTRYERGESTILDLLTSNAQLVAAREALIRARYDQRIARAELEALIGRDL